MKKIKFEEVEPKVAEKEFENENKERAYKITKMIVGKRKGWNFYRYDRTTSEKTVSKMVEKKDSFEELKQTVKEKHDIIIEIEKNLKGDN